MDVDGLDASAKLAILASIAFNVRVVHKNVYAEGIRGISELDIEYLLCGHPYGHPGIIKGKSTVQENFEFIRRNILL